VPYNQSIDDDQILNGESVMDVAFVNAHPSRQAEISVHGNSGCRVRIAELGGRVVVAKSALDRRYSDRLRKQIEKQRLCQRENELAFLRVPKILAESDEAGLYRADMEYVYFHNSIDFFALASRPLVDSVLDKIFRFVDAEIAASRMQTIAASELADKISSIEAAIRARGEYEAYRGSVAKIRRELARRDRLEIPVGRCHGDLTFSNIMIARDASAIALIDFLDSFIESPIMDLAKLRQDTLFEWTLLMGEHIEDPIRFGQIMRYLDREIAEKYSAHDWYRAYGDLILAVNVLRIAPYARSPAVRGFIINCIDSLRFADD
jgi:thiamine kinase-like enzyme